MARDIDRARNDASRTTNDTSRAIASLASRAASVLPIVTQPANRASGASTLSIRAASLREFDASCATVFAARLGARNLDDVSLFDDGRFEVVGQRARNCKTDNEEELHRGCEFVSK